MRLAVKTAPIQTKPAYAVSTATKKFVSQPGDEDEITIILVRRVGFILDWIEFIDGYLHKPTPTDP
jgi:hypothetical protein